MKTAALVFSVLIFATLFASQTILAQYSSSPAATIVPVAEQREEFRQLQASRAASLKESRLTSKAAEFRASVEKRLVEAEKKREAKVKRLEARLKNFKNQKKAGIVKGVNKNLSTVNTNRTSQMSSSLEKMAVLADKLQEKQNKLSTEGKDITAASKSLVETRTAITKAQTAISAQSTKDYTVSVSSETNLKKDTKTARDNLHKDLQAAHDLVIKARQLLAQSYQQTAVLGGDKADE